MGDREESREGAAPEKGPFDTILMVVGAGAILLSLGWLGPFFLLAPASFGAAYLVRMLRRRIKKASDEGKQTISARLKTGLLRELHRAMFGFAVACSIAAAIQLLCWTFPGLLAPTAFGDLQLRLYDLADQLKTQVAGRVALAMLAVLILAAAMTSLRPILALAGLRKLLGTTLGLLIALAGFGFVTVQTAAPAYGEELVRLRATIAGHLDAIRRARQEQAALQWIGAVLLRDVRNGPRPGLVEAAAESCRLRQRGFDAGYGSARPGEAGVYCTTASRLIEMLLQDSATAGEASDGHGDWTPDLGDAGAMLRDGVGRAAALLPVRDRAARVKTDAERARDAVRGTVVKTLGELVGLPEPTPC